VIFGTLYASALIDRKEQTMDSFTDVPVKRWELNAIVIEIVVLSGVTMGLAVGFLGRVPMFARLPRYVLNGIGFGFLGLLLIPGLSLLSRQRQQQQISLRSGIARCVAGAFVYMAISLLLQYTLHW
jgi:hypothetical protein